MPIKRFLVLTMLLGLAACSSQREPAQAAIQSIQMTFSAAKADGAKYAPAELASVEAKVTELQASFDKKDFNAVVEAAPAVLKQAQDLHGVIFNKKTEAKNAAVKEWSTLVPVVMQQLPAVQSQYAKLKNQKKTTPDVDLATAQSALEGIDPLWTSAQQGVNRGQVESGLAEGKEVKARIEKAAMAMKFTLPEVKASSSPAA